MFNEIKRTERNIRLLNRMFEEYNTNNIYFSRHDNIVRGNLNIAVRYDKNQVGYFDFDTDLYYLLNYVAQYDTIIFVYNNIDLLENGSIDEINKKISEYICYDCVNRFYMYEKKVTPTYIHVTKEKISFNTKTVGENDFIRHIDNDFEQQKNERFRLNKKGVITNKRSINRYVEYCIFESFKCICNELLNEKKYQI